MKDLIPSTSGHLCDEKFHALINTINNKFRMAGQAQKQQCVFLREFLSD